MINKKGQNKILPAAHDVKNYLPLLKNKSIALVANHTTVVGEVHLADTLLALGIDLVKIFSPEHGFKGKKAAGEQWEAYADNETGLPIVSLYGRNKKPLPEDIQGIDIVVFDIQDVGVRFYTYISTMHYVMEACAEHDIDFIVLDRPNPNGFYVDGPVLDTNYSSFVGMHPVPIVYGMTIAEYARMINGQGWLKNGVSCNLKCIPCINYTHQSYYKLKHHPSPNLQNMRSIYLYPSLGLFEGTKISIGRGTDFPFQVFGHPELDIGNFHFTPYNMPGIANNPKHEGKKCKGFDLRDISLDTLRSYRSIQLKWLINAYNHFPENNKFFTSFFNTLVGGKKLQEQIKSGISPKEIRESWQQKLDDFKAIRKQYLMYEDFQ
jgi:uncharacterized protein YbbC (DUF1343 family)